MLLKLCRAEDPEREKIGKKKKTQSKELVEFFLLLLDMFLKEIKKDWKREVRKQKDVGMK